MEEKKIIGQECEFYDEGHCLCYSDESHYPHCLEYPNCYYKQLQLKDNELNQLNKARDEICASGQPDYIGIIRDKNIELQLKDKMIELMKRDIEEEYACDLELYKQQALAELEE